MPICCRNKSCDGRIEDGVQCGKCNSCRCAGCLKTFPPETYGAHLDKCPANSASKKPLKAEKNGVHGEGLCPENGNGGKRKCVFRCGNCGILGHTQKSCPELYLLKSKKKARIESKKKRSTLSFEELKEEENSEEESSHEEEEDEDVPPSTEEEDEDEDIVEGTKEEEEKEMDVEAFYHATLSNLNCSKNSFGNSLKMLAKVVPEAQIHANRENLERIYKTYTDSLHSESSRAPSSVSLNGKKEGIPSSLRPPSVNTSLSKKAPANGVIEILTTSSEDTSPLEELPLAVQEVKISLPPHASSTPPIECVVAFGGCGVVNPASHLSCSQCSNLLWSATNRFGDQFYLGQRVTFWRKKTGLSYEGKLVRIYPLVAGVEPEIKFKVSYFLPS